MFDEIKVEILTTVYARSDSVDGFVKHKPGTIATIIHQYKNEMGVTISEIVFPDGSYAYVGRSALIEVD